METHTTHTTQTRPPITAADLEKFKGTEFWYQTYGPHSSAFTDGIKFIAEHGGAYWLIDYIVLRQIIPEFAAVKFQIWRLKVNPDNTAEISCEGVNGSIIHKEAIPYTDFPMDELVLFHTNKVLLLPSEV